MVVLPHRIEEWFEEARRRGEGSLDEPTGKALLASFGIDVPKSRVLASDDDVKVDGLEGPFALKVIAPGVLHKTDVGGVQLGIANVDELAATITRLRRRLRERGIEPSGWLVEEMVPSGIEVVVGGTIDPEFGPMVMVGLGGIFVEVIKDVAFRICPITECDAEEMIDDLRGAPVLRGVRGQDAVAIDAVIKVLVRLGGAAGLFMQCASEVSEIDINPLIVSHDGAVAVDARFVLRGRLS